MNFGLWFIGIAILECAEFYAKKHKIIEKYDTAVHVFILIIGIICLLLDVSRLFSV